MKILVLGSKEYPFGCSVPGEDPHPSGGMELYVDNLTKFLGKANITIVTRKFKGLPETEKKRNIEIIRVPFIKGFYLRNPSFNFFSLLRSLNIDFDVIISHDDIASFIGLILSRIRKKPIIMVCHGLPSEQPQYNALLRSTFRLIEKINYRHSSANITHSPHQLEKITNRYDIIYPGFDRLRARKTGFEDKRRLKEKYNIGDKKTIVFIGRVIRVKGIEYLLKALNYVKQPYICFIVGDGPQTKEYKKLAKELNVNAIFTGFRKDANRFLSIANVFIIPSFSESLSYSLLEAAHMKVPIVSTNLGIIPEDAAILVEKGDEKTMGAAINKILSDKECANRISMNAKKFSENFDWKAAAQKYYEIIGRVL